MRTIEQTSRFKGDLKREAKGPHRQTLKEGFVAVLAALAGDQPLAEKYQDHALTGDWIGYRECHIKPDLLLIYQKQGAVKNGNDGQGVLRLARLGSHSELFG